MNLTATTAIEQAVEFCAAELAEDWTPELETATREGSPYVWAEWRNTSGNGRTGTVWAMAVVELPSGDLVDVCHPIAQRVTLKRGQTGVKLAQWWARKHFGRELAVHVTHRV